MVGGEQGRDESTPQRDKPLHNRTDHSTITRQPDRTTARKDHCKKNGHASRHASNIYQAGSEFGAMLLWNGPSSRTVAEALLGV